MSLSLQKYFFFFFHLIIIFLRNSHKINMTVKYNLIILYKNIESFLEL